MTKKEFVQLISLTKAYIQSFKLEEEQYSIWYGVLNDFDYDIAHEAIKKLAQTSKFAPTIAGIREAYMQVKNGDFPSLEKTLNDMQRMASKFGRYNMVEGYKWLEGENEVAYRIMKAISYDSYGKNDVAYMTPTIKKLHTEIVNSDAEVKLLQGKFAKEIGAIRARGLIGNE